MRLDYHGISHLSFCKDNIVALIVSECNVAGKLSNCSTSAILVRALEDGFFLSHILLNESYNEKGYFYL